MAMCEVCKQFFPPGFTDRTNDGKKNICLFCKRDVREIKYYDDDIKQMKIASKTEIIKEYDKFIKEIKENPNVKKMIVEDAVRKSSNGY